MSSNILGSEWSLSPDGIKTITENGAVFDKKLVLSRALDCDLKAIGKAALANELAKSEVGQLVLQIQKIRNISAPKAKEGSQAAPRMLKFILTDGESYVQAIEISPINAISREKTAPGTKVLVKGAKVVSGYLLVHPQNFSVLGGKVEHLFDKWILAKSIQQNHQHVSNEGAPPWVAFGGKIISGSADGSFRSLEKSKGDNTDSEFDQQRKDAIAEAATGAVKKSFGGRVRENVQPVQNTNQYQKGRQNDRGDQNRGRRGRFASRNDDDDDGAEAFQKPSEKISLFSFLADKLPNSEPKKPDIPSSSCNKNSYQNYHQKDPRMQTRSEGNSHSRPLDDKTISNNTNRYKANYNSNSASKPSAPGTKSSSASNSLPHKSYETSKSSTNENGSSGGDASHFRGNQGKYGNEAKNYMNHQQYREPLNQNRNSSNKYGQSHSQGASNQKRNGRDRYSTNPPTENLPRDNSNQQYSQYRNSNEIYTQQENAQTYPKVNSGEQRNEIKNASQQSSNSNNQYSEHSQQYNRPQTDLSDVNMHQLANNLSKMAVSNEFASRSLRHHLNLGPPKQDSKQEPESNSLGVGEQCLAKYWEDGKFYPAVIAAVTEKTYAVQFKGYGNIEEVLKQDCFAAHNSQNQNRNANYNNYPNNFTGDSLAFRSRRGPPRN